MGAILRDHLDGWLDTHVIAARVERTLRDLSRCRTAALGGHLEVCTLCGDERPAYNSCRNRHCPRCMAVRQDQWVSQRMKRMPPTTHFHVIFTLPSSLRAIAQRNRKLVFNLMLSAASRALQGLAKERMDAQLGIMAVVHTWTQELLFHPHIHCVVTGGGLSLDGERWVPSRQDWLFPVAQIRSRYRRFVAEGLQAHYRKGELDLDGLDEARPKAFRGLVKSLYRVRWVVHVQPPVAGVEQIVRYLGRYVCRVAIADTRIVAVKAGRVEFTTRDRGVAKLTVEDFISRFAQHVLPHGFRKIRQYGLFAPSNVNTKLVKARELLGPGVDDQASSKEDDQPGDQGDDDETAVAIANRLTGGDVRKCPVCKLGDLVHRPLPDPHRRGPGPPAATRQPDRIDSS